VDNLWEEKITNSGWFSYLTGIALLSYLWNRSAAKTEDKAFGATIVDLNNAAAALVNRVAFRKLTADEARARGVPQVKFADPNDQANYAGTLQQAENREKEFYDVFKTRCSQLGVNMADIATFGEYSAAAQAHLDSLAENYKPRNIDPPVELMPQKMDTAKAGFGKRIFQDMVDAYASQPIDNITIDSYRKAVADILGFFKNGNSVVDIETSLRQALKTKHDQAFNQLANVYMNPANDNAKMLEKKATLTAKFTAEKNVLVADLAALRGPNENNGTINDAYVRRETARTALEDARVAFWTAFQGVFGTVTRETSADVLANLSFEGFTPEMQAAKTTLITKLGEFRARDQELQALIAKLNELATFTWDAATNTNKITGGKVFEADRKLVDVDLTTAARAEATKVGSFYRELHEVVTEDNKQDCYDRMHHPDVIGA
jgi:hypothetical protein